MLEPYVLKGTRTSMLEPYVLKGTRTVLRRGETSNCLFLFDLLFFNTKNS